MSSWYEKENEQAAEGLNPAKWLWGGVGLLIVAFVAGLFMMGEPNAAISQVQVRHILLRYDAADPADRQRKLELAQRVKAQLDEGASFDALARKYSNDPGSASRGGALGWNARDTFTDAFEEMAWSLPVGEISDVFNTQFGFHILQVTDRKIAVSEQYDAELERKARDLRSKPAAGDNGE